MIPLATHPAVLGARNLTDCDSIPWPVAVTDDVVGQTLDTATTELVCVDVDAKQPSAAWPIEYELIMNRTVTQAA